MSLPSPSDHPLAQALPPAEATAPASLGLRQTALGRFSQAAAALAARLLPSAPINAPKMWEQAKSSPKAFASAARVCGREELENRWSAAIMTAGQGQPEALIETLRSGALFCPPEHSFYFAVTGSDAHPRMDLESLIQAPDASQALLSALAAARLPASTTQGVICLVFEALALCERPFELLSQPRARGNFERALTALCSHPFDNAMIALARSPNLADLARAGLLESALWTTRSPFTVEPDDFPAARHSGCVAFFGAALGQNTPQSLGPSGALNVARMARSLIDKGLFSEDRFAQSLVEAQRRFPQNAAFYAQAARRVFQSAPPEFSQSAALTMAFESDALENALPPSPSRPSMPRAL